MHGEHKRRTAALLLLALLPLRAASAEEVLVVDLLDNGGFEEEIPGLRGPDGLVRVPWWRTSLGAEQVVGEPGARALSTAEGTWARQPVAAYAPLAERLVVRGSLVGAGRVTLVDGSGERATVALESPAGETLAFELPAARFAEALGRPLVPRFVLELSSDEPARWDDVAVDVALPCPNDAELRAEIVRELDWIFGLWLEHGLDDVGPEASFLPCHLIDAVSGERLVTGAVGLHPLITLMREAAAVEDEPRWRDAVGRFLDELLVKCLHPVTGLPRTWDVERDAGRDAPVEIHSMLGFLLDVVREGPTTHVTRALDASLRIGEHVLERGVLPDGNVAASYFPESGAPNTEVSVLRRLDVPAQLARLGALTERFEFSRTAREACVTLEFTNYWPGTWDAIDPGWDDNYGHYGRRAATMWQAHPEDAVFRGLALDGATHYHELWRDALRLGGNVAADQVRCWEILADVAELEPGALDEIRGLLHAAARSHFKGEQYGNGAWGDVTIYEFDPKGNLNVGDLPGTPRNLVHGLAVLYDEELGLRTPEVRAMFTAVLRSTREHYRRPFGYLTTREELAGHDYGGGEIRLAVGLCEMLRRLSE